MMMGVREREGISFLIAEMQYLFVFINITRCTTVYLVDRRTDMLPKLLTETLCSLKDDGDRLAFSVVWEIDRDANIIQTRYHKSIIRSVASLSYG